MKRLIVAEFEDDGSISARLGVRNDASTTAIVVVATISAEGEPSNAYLVRCTADEALGGACRILGGKSRHDNHPELLPAAFVAFETGQEALFGYLETLL